MITFTIEISQGEEGGSITVRHGGEPSGPDEKLLSESLKRVLQAWVRAQNEAHEGALVSGIEDETEVDQLIQAIHGKRDELRNN